MPPISTEPLRHPKPSEIVDSFKVYANNNPGLFNRSKLAFHNIIDATTFDAAMDVCYGDVGAAYNIPSPWKRIGLFSHGLCYGKILRHLPYRKETTLIFLENHFKSQGVLYDQADIQQGENLYDFIRRTCPDCP